MATSPSPSRERVLRHTRGTCPICIREVPARVVVRQGEVRLVKRCPEHGEQSALLSRRPDYYEELHDYYFDLHPGELPQRDYILRLTARCNMSCPICLASSDQYPEQDLPRETIRELWRGRRRVKLDLMGAEPTLRHDLVDLVREATAAGHITALHTNGILIADEQRLRSLVDAGLSEVHLQYDGLDDSSNEVLRGRPMAAVRRRVLATLEKLDVATDLVVTLMRGVNEDQMAPALDYAAAHRFVKEVFFLGMRRLGRASERFATEALSPDEVIDALEEQTGGRITRDQVRVFNKLYFALLAMFRLRKCFYIHHYMVARDGRGGWRPVSDLIDLPYLDPHLDRFRRLWHRSRAVASAYLTAQVGVAVARKGGLALITDCAVLPLLLRLGFDLSRIQRRLVLLGFITACDPWIHDTRVALMCGKGELASDIGRHESGADANVARERLHLELDSEA